LTNSGPHDDALIVANSMARSGDAWITITARPPHNKLPCLASFSFPPLRGAALTGSGV